MAFEKTLEPTLAARLDARELGAGRVRLPTLVLVRWVAVIGQTVALVFVHAGLGFSLPLLPAFALVALSALFNVVLTIRFPPRTRLGDDEAAYHLAYDALQLALLLFLTGGLSNPFALLLLVPVAISATVLSLRSTIWLAVLGIVCISLLAVFNFPLPWGRALVIEPTYILGTWAALALGTAFLTAYAWRVALDARRMSDALVEAERALAHANRVSALGAAAAVAHELGTPLSTIAVVAKEMSRELPAESPFREDVDVLTNQIARCRDVLMQLSMLPATFGEITAIPLTVSALVAAIAAPYRVHEIEIKIIAPNDEEPLVRASPEVIQGLGNLIRNGIDFARRQVDLELSWDEAEIRIEISDDGPGFSSNVFGLLGEPYVTTRGEEGGTGLGVFVARTLLERTGACLGFSNANGGGAKVAIRWPRAALEVGPAGDVAPSSPRGSGVEQ